MDLIAKDICHSYGPLTVLDHITFTIHDREIVALIGPSGCGKSTLLGILGGILKQSSGDVMVSGDIPAASINPFTYVFQDFALVPWRTVESNVDLVLEHHDLSQSRRHEIIVNVLERTGLSQFAKAYPKQLSGGMKQRVGIARALAVNPAILLMDEPFSALDAQTRDLLLEDFLALWLRERMAAAYVTHNLSEALRVADCVLVMSRRPGRVREIVPISIPQADRTLASAQIDLNKIHQRLWQLIKEEATIADREIQGEGQAHV